MSNADFIREVEDLYLRLANADTDDLVELAKLAGLESKPAIQIEMVKVPDATFAIGKYPITQSQYEAVMGVNPSYFKNNPQNPVEQVSYDDAIAFCQELSQVTGKNYRLPTEVEWEYACRAGTTTDYYFGDYFDDNCNYLKDYAWYYDNSRSTTHSVGFKRPNAWGLYDMHGNVWEWCQKGYMRGGSWGSSPTYCFSDFRHNYDRRSFCGDDIGFRVVCNVNQ
jgi:formylglycine-generating enzyme required for sulfatase activity